MGGLQRYEKWPFLTILEAKIAYFHDYEPFNQVFGANFVPWLKGPDTKDFLSKFFSVNVFVPWGWGLLKGSKIVIFEAFLAIIAYVRPILASRTHLCPPMINFHELCHGNCALRYFGEILKLKS